MIETIFESFSDEIREKRMESIRLPFAALHTRHTVSFAAENTIIEKDCKKDDYVLTDIRITEHDVEPEPCRTDYHIPKQNKIVIKNNMNNTLQSDIQSQTMKESDFDRGSTMGVTFL